MKNILLLLLICSLITPKLSAHNFCAEQRQKNTHILNAAKTALASPLLDDYDVKYVILDLQINPLNTFIQGNALTTAMTQRSMSTYAFELNDSLTIDSAKFNGIPVATSHIASNVQGISLGTPLSAGNLFSVQIYYHGSTPNGNGFFTHGLNHYSLPHGVNITFSLSDPNLARDWWPCKQSLTDKIDSARLWFTVPAGYMAGSNGRLRAVTPMGGPNFRYEWSTYYPIEYYLISVSAAPYVLHQQRLRFSGSGDTMAVQHFVYDTAYYMPSMRAALDSTPQVIDYFSQLFGRYPFWKEKYGHCIAPLSGGMEHQTMTTLGVNLPTYLIAHELGHQWWGDHVTYSSWRDVWLSEGWASYCEQLFKEHFQGDTAALLHRKGVFARVMSGAGGSVIVDDTTNVYRIFDSRLTYDKGAAVAHMLRYIAPSDSVFFSGLKAYQQHFAFGLANTDSFQKVMEAAYGFSLDTFFTQWVYGQGYPIYSGSWNQRDSDVYIELRQAGSSPSNTPLFSMPLDLQLTTPGGADSIVRVYFDQATQQFHLRWARQINGFNIDPGDNIVNWTNAISKDPSLGLSGEKKTGMYVAPNPSDNGFWMLHGITYTSRLVLCDMSGRVVWEKEKAKGNLEISNSQLPVGVYHLQVYHTGTPDVGFLLEKR